MELLSDLNKIRGDEENYKENGQGDPDSTNGKNDQSLMAWMDDKGRRRWSVAPDGKKHLWVSEENLCGYSLEDAAVKARTALASLNDSQFDEFLAAWSTLKKASLESAMVAFLLREMANGEPDLVDVWVGERVVHGQVGITV